MFKKGRSKGGVDNVRYITEVIEPIVIPFWKELTLQWHEPDEFPCDIIPYSFQHDNAPAHASKWTKRRLKKEGLLIHEHTGNSPETNAIEQAWMPMRIAITKDWGAPSSIDWADRAWRGQWDLLPQDAIRAMVIRMAAINTLIIEHEGGNEFHG